MSLFRVPRVRAFVAFTALVLFALVAGGAAFAADIKVLSSTPMKEPLLALATAFEAASGHKIVVGFGGTDAITKRIAMVRRSIL